MLKFTVAANDKTTIEISIETNEIRALLNMVERHKSDYSIDEFDSLETIHNKIKALYFLDKLPDEQGLKQIQEILFPSDEINKANVNNIKIQSLSFSKRTFHCLDRANIKTLGELLCLSEDELLRIRNLGVQSLNEIIDTLKKYDLTLPSFKNA